MKIEIHSVKGYNSPRKKILSIDGIPVLCADSVRRLGFLISYIQGGSEESLADKSMVKILKPYREKWRNENP